MNFGNELLSAAVKGMENHQPDVDARHLLLKVGKQNLQKRAGYLPASNEIDLPIPVSRHNKRLINLKAQEHLGKLTQDKDFYYALPEWCITAANLSLGLPPEWMPVLLKVGSAAESLRPYIMLLMDSRAYFLAEQSSPELHWDWIFKQALLTLDEIETSSEREGITIMRSFEVAQERADQNLAMMNMVRLSTIKPPWNIWLADSFMSFMRRSMYQGQLISIFSSPFIERLAKYLPLEYADNFIIIMDNGLGDSKWWQSKRDSIQTVFDFRRKIISSLEESCEESYL